MDFSPRPQLAAGHEIISLELVNSMQFVFWTQNMWLRNEGLDYHFPVIFFQFRLGGATPPQWANLGPHVVKLNQYRYLMYFQPNFHVGILYEHCVCIFCICGFVFL